MGLRTAGSTVQLNDLKGELIALKYLGQDITVDTQFGRNTAARADVVKFEELNGELTARRMGATLVFQQAIQNEIRGSSDWSVGIFEEVDRPLADAPDATMYQLTEPDLTVDAIANAMRAANISLD